MNCWDELGRDCSGKKKKLPAFRWQPASPISYPSVRSRTAAPVTRKAQVLLDHPTLVRGFVSSSFFAFFKVFFAMLLPPLLP
jgi:hypothetical protein